MKNSRQQTPNHNIKLDNNNIKLDNNKRRAENKDDLDSREGEEQLSKGSQITHNKKEKQNDRKKVKS